MQKNLTRSTRIARTGLAILILGLLITFGCLGLFLQDPEQPIWVVIGVAVLIVCVVVELLCLRQARKLFLRHYSRVGMRLKDVNFDSDLFHRDA